MDECKLAGYQRQERKLPLKGNKYKRIAFFAGMKHSAVILLWIRQGTLKNLGIVLILSTDFAFE